MKLEDIKKVLEDNSHWGEYEIHQGDALKEKDLENRIKNTRDLNFSPEAVIILSTGYSVFFDKDYNLAGYSMRCPDDASSVEKYIPLNCNSEDTEKMTILDIMCKQDLSSKFKYSKN